MDTFKRTSLEYFEAESSKPPEPSDLHFFIGLLFHIEEISQQQKLNIQEDELNLIRNIYDKT
jgi:hypothetical protein